MAMTDDHAEAVERAFTAQAAAFEDRRFNRVFTADVDWMFEELDLRPEHLLLDVAAGTGHVSRALAPSVAAVVAIDATAAMLATGRAAADRAGLRNVVFLRADATALPFLDATFDVVVSRFAVHHFADPAVALAEMARCLRPGGQLAVADMVSDDDPAVARTQNGLERLRDPSHTRMLTAAELRAALEHQGLAVAHLARRTARRPLGPWLAQTAPGEDAVAQIAAALRAELAGGPVTGLVPQERDGELSFVQHFAAATAVRPA